VDTRVLLKKSPVPALAALALALVTITVLSPSPPDAGGGESMAPTLPPAPVAARKELVPVRHVPSNAPPTPGAAVALRQLIVATSPADFGLATWKAVLDGIGSPYDVLFASTEPLTPQRLAGPDGVGRYDAVLLTDSALLVPGDGGYHSAFDEAEWQALWDYERTFGVRQVSLNTAPGAGPEDYCLRARGEGAVGETPVRLGITGTGAGVFDYLDPRATIPVSQSYLYRAAVAPGCAAQPILTLGRDVMGVLSTTRDGRERAAVTFSTGTGQLSTDLLGYGLVRWATKGVFLGEQRHWLGVDVDDWFNATLRRQPDGTAALFRMSGPEAVSVDRQQTALRRKYPLAGDFTLNLPYNGSKIDSSAPARCDTANTPDALTSFSRCLMDRFRWINHTLTHPQLNFTSYQENRTQIADNLTAAASIGLPVPATVLKTPEYSGLGVYNPDPNSLDPPVDHGLAAANPDLLRAAVDLGVKYLHGNMSFPSHRPSCFNCGVRPPLRPELMLVPDWPTNIAFEATTPEEQLALYNIQYGKHGKAPDHGDHDLSYPEMVDAEAEVALQHLVSGSAYVHTLHQGNLHEYAPDKSITFDWLNAVLAKYSAYYRVPLKNPDWLALADYVRARTEHAAAVGSRRDAVWNRATGEISRLPAGDGSLFLTGVATRPATEQDQHGPDEAEHYGSDSIARLDVPSGSDTNVALTANPRP
jgi:hypothetical protein